MSLRGHLQIQRVVILIFLIIFLKVECAQDATSKKELYFSFITALTGTSTSSGGIPVIELALEQINSDSRLLPDYQLKHTAVLDSECKSISAIENFLQHFDNETEPTYITSMCCGCSSATIPVAEISHHWNVPQISFASNTPILNNRDRFKSIFRTLPCYVYVPPTIATIMKEFQWKQMGVITQDESPFNDLKLAFAGVQAVFEERGWKLGQRALINPTLNEVNYTQLLDWDEDYRIILINTFEVHTYHILCEVYRKYGQRLLDQEIVILMHGRYMTEWWETAYLEVNSSCTREEVMRALNKTFALTPETYALMENTSAMAFSGITPLEFLSKYQSLLKEDRYASYTPLNFFGNAYDAMWVAAYGLDLVDTWAKNGMTIDECELNYPGELVPLDQFNYTNRRMGCYLREAFHKVEIVGVTGPIKFKSDGARPENVMRLRQHRIRQQGDDFVVTRPAVARVVNEDSYSFGMVHYDGNGSVVFSASESSETIWPGGIIPYDGSPQDVVDRTHLALTIAFVAAGFLGLCFAAVAMFFNIMCRKKRVVKLSSPNLNLLIITGATLLYLALFVYSESLPDTWKETILCNFRIWLFSIGTTLCFAVILAKQWRIYYIFSNPTPNKMVIKDWMLFAMVTAIVGLELVILLVGTAIPESKLTANATLVNELRPSNGPGVNEKVYILICANSNAVIWIAISFGYKALLQLGALFMAFTTRKVKVKGLSDTKETYAIIYINTVIITMLIVTEFTLRYRRDAYFSLYGVAIFFQATLFLALTFIPKVLLLYKDPDGKTVFTENDSHPALSPFSVTQSQDILRDLTIPEIQANIAQLQQQLTYLEKKEVLEQNGVNPRTHGFMHKDAH